MIDPPNILQALPYSDPFLFADEIQKVDENGCEGSYVFRKSLPFYEGHFKGNPITPGVILTECCAQIGLVCFGIYLMAKDAQLPAEDTVVAMTSSEMEFLKPVYPEERVRVRSEKVYFRFSKLKCKVTMFNARDEIVCKGQISGILKSKKNA